MMPAEGASHGKTSAVRVISTPQKNKNNDLTDSPERRTSFQRYVELFYYITHSINIIFFKTVYLRANFIKAGVKSRLLRKVRLDILLSHSL